MSWGVEAGTRAECLGVIDKAGRAGPGKTGAALAALGIGAAATEALTELMADGSWNHLRDRFGDADAVLAAMEPLREHRQILEAMGLGGYLHFDFTVVRGLAYYTGIVFELFDRAGRMRAICGGGRYDRLLELVGGEPLPAVGFGMGDVVLRELLRDRALVPEAAAACDDYVIWVEPSQRPLGLEAARRLRAAGRSVLYDLKHRGVGKQLRSAARAGAARAVIIGPDEAADGTVTVRDLRTGRQEAVAADAIARAPAGDVAGSAGDGGGEGR